MKKIIFSILILIVKASVWAQEPNDSASYSLSPEKIKTFLIEAGNPVGDEEINKWLQSQRDKICIIRIDIISKPAELTNSLLAIVYHYSEVRAEPSPTPIPRARPPVPEPSPADNQRVRAWN